MNTYLTAYQALSDSTRLRILSLLAYAKTPVCVCEFVDSLEEPQYHISRCLGVLQKAGMIEAKKEGRWVYYELPKRMNTFLAALMESIKKVSVPKITKDRRGFRKRLKLRENGKCSCGLQTEKVRRGK